MDFQTQSNQSPPHVVCLPMPAQGHINPMMTLAGVLQASGFTVTFVLTDFDRSRLLRSAIPDALLGSDSFRFASFPDGLPPPSRPGNTGNRNIPSLCDSLRRTGFGPFRELLKKIDGEGPRVTAVVWDGITSFGGRAARDLGMKEVMFWTASAAGLMSYLHFPELVERGILPLPDESCLSDGYLDTPVDWIPGMKDFKLRDLPGILRTTDPDDIMFNFVMEEAKGARDASAIFMNTFDELEPPILSALAAMLPPVHTIGPLCLLPKHSLPATFSLWKEDGSCVEWLEGKNSKSVVYVNFGSIINLTAEQLAQFAGGLVDSRQCCLWVIRPDLVLGDGVRLLEKFKMTLGESCLIATWCSQERVLRHPAVGAFVTHSGWNSILEALCSGVPLLCWPRFAEQTTNCYYACEKWGFGVEIGNEVRREVVGRLVKEVMEGKKGEEMREKAAEWKEKAEKTVGEGGNSYLNLKVFVDSLLGKA